MNNDPFTCCSLEKVSADRELHKNTQQAEISRFFRHLQKANQLTVRLFKPQLYHCMELICDFCLSTNQQETESLSYIRRRHVDFREVSALTAEHARKSIKRRKHQTEKKRKLNPYIKSIACKQTATTMITFSNLCSKIRMHFFSEECLILYTPSGNQPITFN